MTGERGRDPQALALGLGAEPLEPLLPNDRNVDDAIDALRAVQSSDAYRGLLARRAAGDLDEATFDQAVVELMRLQVST